MLALGTPHGLEAGALESLGSQLLERRPSEAVVGKAVEILQAASEAPVSRGLVGKQCSSIVVPSDPSVAASMAYHTATAVRKTYQPSYIEARGGDHGVFIIGGGEMAMMDESESPAVIAVPKVGRNQPCPCGSGRKYKKCHGEPRRQGDGFEMGFGGF